jgi:hypothetical protein
MRPHIAFYEEKTEVVPAIQQLRTSRIILTSPHNTEPMLPLDRLGRACLVYSGNWDNRGSLWDDTLYHVERLVSQYRERTGEYPAEICLSLARELARARHLIRKYCPRDHRAKAIPFVWEWHNVGRYEVLVRGRQ